MNHIKNISLAVAVCVALAGAACGGSAENVNADTQDIEVSQRDSAIYKLGRVHARRMLERCTTTDLLRNELLDVRARESLIKARMYPEAAQAYIQGFRHAVCESGDTLAQELFGESL